MVLHEERPSVDGRLLRRAIAALMVTLVVALGMVADARAVPPPAEDPFYVYDGAKPLAEIEPGTVLRTRTVPYHVFGLPLPLTAVQVLYRSTGQLGQPTVDATSIVRGYSHPRDTLVSFQSAYDSLNPNDQPSYAIAGGRTWGGSIANLEAGMVAPFLLAGFTVAIPDTEGQAANFAAGPEYGKHTLDGIRAAFNAEEVGLDPEAKVGLFGYSGGAIASEWAAELAPTYAPDVNRRLAGAAIGGVFVNPARNLRYVDGSLGWAGVIPMAIIGIARSFQVDLAPYLSDEGRRLYEKLKDASIVNVLAQYPGLSWKTLAKPEYANPESVPVFVEVVNKLIMGTGGTPTIPLFIGQAANGGLEGTPGGKPGIGAGDGVMVAGDVRSLARRYCEKGLPIEYQQYDSLSHLSAMPLWWKEASRWMADRLEGKRPPDTCSTIEPGNPLDPVVAAKP
ncbi:lipase family protein [Patulibacter defluvii]|uniref:lipase family protein n=1 Tax=Patulibacter defluvii TaxID=3095358 RepID=UPI002A75DEF5|nr:lipase family protein [Patulibacter sp. DM4]